VVFYFFIVLSSAYSLFLPGKSLGICAASESGVLPCAQVPGGVMMFPYHEFGLGSNTKGTKDLETCLMREYSSQKNEKKVALF
jgi:hypothetical protein